MYYFLALSSIENNNDDRKDSIITNILEDEQSNIPTEVKINTKKLTIKELNNKSVYKSSSSKKH